MCRKPESLDLSAIEQQQPAAIPNKRCFLWANLYLALKCCASVCQCVVFALAFPIHYFMQVLLPANSNHLLDTLCNWACYIDTHLLFRFLIPVKHLRQQQLSCSFQKYSSGFAICFYLLLNPIVHMVAALFPAGMLMCLGHLLYQGQIFTTHDDTTTFTKIAIACFFAALCCSQLAIAYIGSHFVSLYFIVVFYEIEFESSNLPLAITEEEDNHFFGSFYEHKTPRQLNNFPKGIDLIEIDFPYTRDNKKSCSNLIFFPLKNWYFKFLHRLFMSLCVRFAIYKPNVKSVGRILYTLELDGNSDDFIIEIDSNFTPSAPSIDKDCHCVQDVTSTDEEHPHESLREVVTDLADLKNIRQMNVMVRCNQRNLDLDSDFSSEDSNLYASSSESNKDDAPKADISPSSRLDLGNESSTSDDNDCLLGMMFNPHFDMKYRSVAPVLDECSSNSTNDSILYGAISPPQSPEVLRHAFCSHMHDQNDNYYDECLNLAGSSKEFMYRDLNFTADSATENPVNPKNCRNDQVNFSAYAPEYICEGQCFKLNIWAYLESQWGEMNEVAISNTNDSNLYGSNNRMISNARYLSMKYGSSINMSIHLPQGISLKDDEMEKNIFWKGNVNNVTFSLVCEICNFERNGNPTMITIKIVSGKFVAFLKCYVVITSSKYSNLIDRSCNVAIRCDDLEVLDSFYHEINYDSIEIERFLGQGNFGEAYLGKYEGKDVCLKKLFLNELYSDKEQLRQELQHEATIMSMFGQHPCLTPIIGACTNPSSELAIVTEYYPLGSLHDHLFGSKDITRTNDLNFSAQSKTKLLRDAANGVLNLHQSSFIHRDIAARNCLIDNDFHLRVSDFGMCRELASFKGNEKVPFFEKVGFGPLKYMAPECIEPPHVFSKGSDAYSFGVLMWEVFTEEHPFANSNIQDAARYICEGGRLSIPTNIPANAKDLMQECFASNPEDRPAMSAIYSSLNSMLKR